MAQAGQANQPNQQRRRDSRSSSRYGRDGWWANRRRSRIKEQVESRININECASCTTLARHRRYTEAAQALQWRGASQVGRMEMNVCGWWWRRRVARTLLNTCICQAPSLQISALPWQTAIHGNQQCSCCCRHIWQHHGVDHSTPPQYF